MLNMSSILGSLTNNSSPSDELIYDSTISHDNGWGFLCFPSYPFTSFHPVIGSFIQSLDNMSFFCSFKYLTLSLCSDFFKYLVLAGHRLEIRRRLGQIFLRKNTRPWQKWSSAGQGIKQMLPVLLRTGKLKTENSTWAVGGRRASSCVLFSLLLCWLWVLEQNKICSWYKLPHCMHMCLKHCHLGSTFVSESSMGESEVNVLPGSWNQMEASGTVTAVHVLRYSCWSCLDII